MEQGTAVTSECYVNVLFERSMWRDMMGGWEQIPVNSCFQASIQTSLHSSALNFICHFLPYAYTFDKPFYSF